MEKHKAAASRSDAVDIETVIYETTNLPRVLHFKESRHEELYPDFLDIDVEKKFPLDCVHGSYRGHDRPIFRLGPKRVSHVAPIAIELKDKTGDNQVFGWPSRDFPENQRYVTVAFKHDSQRPATCIFFRQSKDKTVGFKIFANSLSRSKNEIGISFAAEKDLTVRSNLPVDIHIRDLAAGNKLWRTDLDLLPHILEPKEGNSGRPHWSNITPNELRRLEKLLDAYRPLTKPEELVVLLNRCNRLSLFRECSVDWTDQLGEFFDYMRTVSYASAHLGNFWWYKLVFPQGDMISNQDTAGRIPLPRWMATKWRVTVKNGQPSNFEAISHSSLLTHNVYPDRQTFAIEKRLSADRELAKKQEKLADPALAEEAPTPDHEVNNLSWREAMVQKPATKGGQFGWRGETAKRDSKTLPWR